MRVKNSVLIIDDDIYFTEVLQALLEEYDNEVLCCHSGSDALKIANEHSFDVIVSDYHMPGMKGDAVCRLLRDSQPDVFIIGCSSECQDTAFLNAGANTFIMKNQLINNIALVMQGRSA
jgi:CheY-like chemotaxis protein